MGLLRLSSRHGSEKALDKQKYLAELPRASLTSTGPPACESAAVNMEHEVHVGGCRIILMYNDFFMYYYD